eukprot:2134942-Amphidinium_carterae.3
MLNPREILGTTGVALHPSFRKEPDQDKLSKVRAAYERDVTRSADVKTQRLPGQTPLSPQAVRSKVKAGMSGKDVQTRPGTTLAVERRPYPFGPVAQERRLAAKQAQGLQEVSSDEDTRPLVPLPPQTEPGGVERQQSHGDKEPAKERGREEVQPQHEEDVDVGRRSPQPNQDVQVAESAQPPGNDACLAPGSASSAKGQGRTELETTSVEETTRPDAAEDPHTHTHTSLSRLAKPQPCCKGLSHRIRIKKPALFLRLR